MDNLQACYDALPAGKAKGVDGVSKEQYGDKLSQNLKDLSQRLKDMRYRPQPKKRSYIPKPGSDKGRPLPALHIGPVVQSAVFEALQRSSILFSHF
jgi:hypothetical protein